MPGIGIGIGIGLSRLNRAAFRGWMSYSDTTLTAVPASDTAMDLAWTNPNISGVTLKNVVVEISTDGVTFTTSATLGAVTSTQVTGLTAGTLYYFRLAFVNSRGVRTGNGGVVSATTFELLNNVAGRSELTMTDAITGGISKILPVTAEFNSTATTQSLTLAAPITFTDGEINIKFKQATYGTAAGGFLSDAGGGQNFIQFRTATTIMIRFGGTVKSYTFNNISTTAYNNLRLVARIDGTTKIRVYNNGVEATEGEQDLAAIKTLYITKIGHYHKMNIPAISIVNAGINVLSMYPVGLGGRREYNISDNANHATWAAVPGISYLQDGTTYYLDNGFKVYEKPTTTTTNADQYVPAAITPTYLESIDYSLKESIAGSATKHNLFPSLIEFADNIFDRSNTEIWGNSARLGYFDAGNPTRWHTSEINQATFDKYINEAYKGKLFTKFTYNTEETGRELCNIYYNSYQLTGGGLSGMLNVCGNKTAVLGVNQAFDTDSITNTITWEEASGATYEIHCSVNGGNRTLIGEVGEGVTSYAHTSCKQAAWLNYWVRPKKGGVVGAFCKSPIVQIPWTWKTDQTTLTQVSIFNIITSANNAITVNWGDGATTLCSTTVNGPLTHDYASVGEYSIYLTGDFKKIVQLDVREQPTFTGDITNWTFPSNFYLMHGYSCNFIGDITDHGNYMSPVQVTWVFEFNPLLEGDVSNWRFAGTAMRDLHLQGTLISGDITNWTFPVSTEAGPSHWVFNNPLITGDITNWILPEGTTWLALGGCNIECDLSKFYIPDTLIVLVLNDSTAATNHIFGDVSGLTIPNNVSSYYGIAIQAYNSDLTGDMRGVLIPAVDRSVGLHFMGNEITNMPRGEFDWVSAFDFRNNACNSAEIDSLLAYIDNYFTGGKVPLINAVYQLNGTGMGIPSAAGLASRTSILGKYTAAGKTCTISVNS